MQILILKKEWQPCQSSSSRIRIGFLELVRTLKISREADGGADGVCGRFCFQIFNQNQILIGKDGM